MISDGKTLTTAVKPLKRYATASAPETIRMETFREGATGALLFGGPTAAPTFVLLNLCAGTDPDVLLDQMGGTLRAGPAHGTGAGGTTLLIDFREGPDLLLRVDPATNLLSAIELKIDPRGRATAGRPSSSSSAGRRGSSRRGSPPIVLSPSSLPTSLLQPST